MSFNTTVECPRCHGDKTEATQMMDVDGTPVMVLIDCTLCNAKAWIDAHEARDYLAGLEIE